MRTSIKITVIAALTVTLVGLSIGCGGVEDICQAASEHVGACVSDQAAPPPGSCDLARAEQLLAQDCAAVQSTMAAGKADGWANDFMCGLGFYSYCEPFSEATGLIKMVGDWRLEEGSTDGWRPWGWFGCPPKMRVEGVTDPSWEIHMTLRTIPEGDQKGQPIYEHPDFTNINGEERCESGDLSLVEGWEVCQRTRVVEYGHLEWRERKRTKAGVGPVKPVPTESYSIFQRLILKDELLVYEWDSDLNSELPPMRCVFAKL